MARRATNSDDTSTAIVAQQRILQQVIFQPFTTDVSSQLKKERDGKVKDVVAKVVADLDHVKRQVSHEREEHERRRKQKKAKILTDIAKSMQKRNAIEEDMMAVVSGLNTTMMQLETRVMEVYDVKEREVQQLL